MSKKNKKVKIVAPPAKASGQGSKILLAIILTAVACWFLYPLIMTLRFRIEADDVISTGNVEKYVPVSEAAKSAQKKSILVYDDHGNIQQLREGGQQ